MPGVAARRASRRASRRGYSLGPGGPCKRYEGGTGQQLSDPFGSPTARHGSCQDACDIVDQIVHIHFLYTEGRGECIGKNITQIGALHNLSLQHLAHFQSYKVFTFSLH